jgi:hypothetical protein
MAAILCNSIGQLIHGTCDAVGSVLTLPCKACGIATDQLTSVCRSPFCLYLSVAIGLNLPPVIFTAKSLGGGYGDEGCASAANWMSVNGALCIINLMAAIYISNAISKESRNVDASPFVDPETGVAQQTQKSPVMKVLDTTIPTQSKSLARVRETLCYDPIVAIYIIIGIFYMVWQTVGMGRISNAMACSEDLHYLLTHSLICGFLFISLGGSTFGCSLCCVLKRL